MSKSKTIDLNERLTRKARQAETVTADPAIPTRMTVTLEQLVPYDQNPRQTQNPKYEEIKDSIRHRGLDEPPSITRRPGSDHYMIRRGGNTRLQILNELWEETKDPRFFNIDCMFHPWVDDEDALAGHLVENDMRGGMMLIERALGAKRWIYMLEEKAGDSISLRKAATIMTKRGWKIDPGNLSKLIYSVDKLLPHIPDALWSGMGMRVVETLRSLEKAYQAYWDAIASLSDKAPAIDWETLWTDTLKAFDDLRFDVPEFRRTLDFKASDALGLSHNTLRSEVDAILDGGQPPAEMPIDPFSVRPPFAPDPRQTTQVTKSRPASPGDGAGTEPEPSAQHVASSPGSVTPGHNHSPAASPPGAPEPSGTPQPGYASMHAPSSTVREVPEHESPAMGDSLQPLHELQDRAYEAAAAFATQVGLPGLVGPLFLGEDRLGRGYGFLLLPISQTIAPNRRHLYWALLNTLFATLEQMTDTQAKNNLKEHFLPESLETLLYSLYPDIQDQVVMQRSLQDQLAVSWLRMTPPSIVGIDHPDQPALQALLNLDRSIAAVRQAVDDDIDSLFLS